MKTIVTIALSLCFYVCAPAVCEAAEVQTVHVEVLYMNHGPMRSTIKNLQELFAKQQEYVVESWFDFESKEGAEFKKTKGVTAHVPCMIWLDNLNSVDVDGNTVTFTGFPTGAGPKSFQGHWNLDELEKALTNAIKAKNPGMQ